MKLQVVAATSARGHSILAIAVGGSVLVHAGLLLWATLQPAPAPKDAPSPSTQVVAAVAFDVHLPSPEPLAPPPPPVAPVAAPAPTVEAVAAPAPRRAPAKPRRATTTAKVAPAPTAAPKPEVAVATAGAGTVEIAAETGAEQGAETAPAEPPVEATQPGGPSHGVPSPAATGEGFDLGGYQAVVRDRVARQQRYPDDAVDRGWEGAVDVRVRVGRDGQLVGSPEVIRSSGYAALDREALRMVRAAAPFRVLPAAYRDETAEIILPIVFELQDGGDF